MIYICCLDAVDATAYASMVLKIKLREQQSEARLISALSHVPKRCRGLDIKGTPEFWTAVTYPTEQPISRNATRDVGRIGKSILSARTVATAVRLRGGTIQRPYDVPASMDAEDVERWLED